MRKPRKKPGPVAAAKSKEVAHLPHAWADERKAVEYMETMRWGDSPACPRCGDLNVYQMRDAGTGERSKRWLWRCRGCEGQYTVKVGTIMEDSAIPLPHWCYAFFMACASKKGISALQIQRMTGVSYKSALFMMHRVRWAMTGGHGGPRLTGIVEVDETYVGGKIRNRTRAQRLALRAEGYRRMPKQDNDKVPVVALVQRGGEVRAMVVPTVTARNVGEALRANVDPSARLMTDENNVYTKVAQPFASHESVKHSLYEYARGEAHINSAESFFSRLKRQLYGTHHAVSPKHLHRYVAEVAFKHNTRWLDDGARLAEVIRGADRRRLTYKQQVAG